MEYGWIQVFPLGSSLPKLINLENVCSIERTTDARSCEKYGEIIEIMTTDKFIIEIAYTEDTWNTLYELIEPTAIQ